MAYKWKENLKWRHYILCFTYYLNFLLTGKYIHEKCVQKG